MTDAETSSRWSEKIAAICQRFEAALRAGETLEGLDAWLIQVPEHVRPQLESELELRRAELCADSIETRILSSDAVVIDGTPEAEQSGVDLVASQIAVGDCETFQGLASDARNALQARLERVSFKIGSRILSQGQRAQGLHLILNGAVDIIDTGTGERIDCDGAGSVLGEMSLLMNQPCSAEVVATSDVEALVLSAEDYHDLTSNHPELEIALSQLVSDRLGGRRHDALCGKTIGGYRLNRCINRGGMGVVYEATNGDTGESVALKMLRHRFIYDDHMQSRFQQEARLLGELRHPNIISLREHFVAYRTRFLVLDLCDGADLYQVLRARGPLDEATVRAVLGQIAQGLLNAHQANVIHRDLKPGNVLVNRAGQVKLTDFGLSKLLNSEVLDRKAVGTPSYMPPEQFRSDRVGPECDWYAIGCLVCEMLTARILFAPDDWRKVFETKRNRFPNDDWPKIEASQELREIIHGSLHPEPSRRILDLEPLTAWAMPVDWLFQPIVRPGKGSRQR